MSKKGIKSRILVGDKLLGTLLHDIDKEGRGYIKFSLKNKIANFVKSADIPVRFPSVLKLNKHISLEISYKFPDNLLEVKKMIDGKIEREFYKVPLPPQSCLFVLRVKDYEFYNQNTKSLNILALDPPPNGNKSIAVIFSFLGENGLPFSCPGYKCREMGIVDLPEKNLNKFCIGITEDIHPFGDQDIQILLPMHSSVNSPDIAV